MMSFLSNLLGLNTTTRKSTPKSTPPTAQPSRNREKMIPP